MSEQNEIKVFSHQEEDAKVQEIYIQVMPLLKGATVNQIEKALGKCLDTVKSCLTVH